jgi:hypothetical protein
MYLLCILLIVSCSTVPTIYNFAYAMLAVVKGYLVTFYDSKLIYCSERLLSNLFAVVKSTE